MADSDPELEQRLANLLAAYDNDLAAGVGPSDRPTEKEGPLEGRFRDAAACLHLLDQLRPGRDPSPPDLQAPADERYQLVRSVATGGIGRVWLAYDSELGREVALKELRPDRLADPDLAARFLHEARVTGQLQHPGIVPVYELAREEDDCPAYYTMRFVRGQTLSEAVHVYHEQRASRRRILLGLIQLLSAFVRVCQTIAYAHAQGVVHCDLKGQNVVCGDFGEVIVLDWGLASETRDTEPPGLPRTSRLPGTPAYMAPEQARGQADRIGPRTDIFGLGAILYEILTGRPPYVGDDSTAMLAQARECRPVRPKALVPTVPKALQAICLKAMAADPEDRFADAAVLAREVQHWLADEPVACYRESLLERGQRWARHNRPQLAILITVALAGGTALAVIGETRSRLARAEVEAEIDRAATRAAMNAQIKGKLEQQLYLHGVALAERELSAHHVARALSLLEDCPEHLRGWEWRALHRLCHGGARVLDKRRDPISAVVCHPDGKRILSAGHDGKVVSWDAVTGRSLGLIAEHPTVVYDLVVHPEGKEFATACWDGKVRLWDLEGRQLVRTFDGPGKAVYRIAFSPDGRLIACVGTDDHVLVRETATGAIRHTIQHESDRIYRVAFSPEGANVVFTTHLGIHFWNLHEAKQAQLLSTGGEYVKAIAFSPDGKLLASGEGDLAQGDPGIVRLWDTTDGRPLGILNGHTEPIFALAFSPDSSRLFSASQDKTVKVWDVSARAEALTLRGHADTVRSVSVSPGGRLLVTGSADGTVRLWDSEMLIPQLAGAPLLHRLFGHDDEVIAVAWPKGGDEVFSMSPSGELRRWDAKKGVQREVIPPPFKGRGFGLAASADGTWLAVAMNDARVRLLDRTGTHLRVLGEQAAGPIKSVAFSPDGAFVATAGWDKTVGLWPTDGQPGKMLPPNKDLPGHKDSVLGVAFHPSGKMLASAGYDNAVCVWELPEGRLLRPPLRGHQSRVLSVAFNPDGSLLASAGNDNVVRLWKTSTWEPAGTLDDHVGTVSALAFSPRGGLLASASHDCSIKLWDVATQTETQTLRGHTGRVHALAFSPDGLSLASASNDRSVCVWSLADLVSPP